jgi:hypothetical protein
MSDGERAYKRRAARGRVEKTKSMTVQQLISAAEDLGRMVGSASMSKVQLDRLATAVQWHEII